MTIMFEVEAAIIETRDDVKAVIAPNTLDDLKALRLMAGVTQPQPRPPTPTMTPTPTTTLTPNHNQDFNPNPDPQPQP